MKLLELAPVEVWTAFEREMHDRFKMSCAVTDTEGFRVTDYENWGNGLCPVLKEKHPEALSSICAVGNQNFTQVARLTGNPVVGECDAGFVKVAVPIFVDGEFLGTAGGCGLLLEKHSVEEFLLEKTTGMSEEDIRALIRDVPVITEAQAWELAEFARRRIAKIVSDIGNVDEEHYKDMVDDD